MRICGGFCLLMIAAAQEQPAKHGWSYSGSLGPSHWGDLSTEFVVCRTGHHQSPIDIRNPRKIDLPSIQFHYKPSPLHIIDNGHTIVITYAHGSFISIGGKKYALQQFHFHHPSEEQIAGKAFDMTVHLVHADEKGHIAVVAVLLRQGPENSLLQQLWNYLPKESGKEERWDAISIDASQILPPDHSYYTFTGSLTTPPCTEPITWFVLKQPSSISAAEINRFSQLYPNNARPVQPLYGRTVLESR